ncbi:ZYBA0S04-05512g1_1 [Zygosaccharomyces bailii CLIB 213]|uniref:non-specific serine/threonine protein kinase n=1 Tax=Zygosaccharomyces bailii (strain CLIB 213 / ATCC 58445 / CBS 680 / BCRC 21525 / NBRC 1098 / NCYC 1416 / NRRL Y-2227) TaxID=1333698 RepID=A0A8J2T5R6_ZYGB2|nr:ZYBA0S04-05512g1_1 [Zygosaccharomyces bailii CLIB 213]
MLTNCQINNFQITSQIGSGAYGLVFHAVDIITENEYAIKAVVKSSSLNDFGKPTTDDNIKKSTVLQTQLYHFFKSFQNKLFLPTVDLDSIQCLDNAELARAPHYKEIAMQLKVHSHENVCTIHQILESPLATFIVMDYIPLDLFTAIVDREYFANNGLLVKKVFLQLCSALDHCQHKGVFHCDIKPENVLLDSNDNVHLCDFGLSTTCQYLAPNVCIGSSYYMAPERILYTSGNKDTVTSFPTSTGDVWSLGVILINLCCIRNPWLKAHQTEDSTFNYYTKNPSVLKRILPVSDELYSLLVRILQVDPYSRIDLRSLMKEVAELESFTVEGPLSNVPQLDEKLYDTFITGDRGMCLREMLKEGSEEDECVSETTPCESDEEWSKQFGASPFMQWAGNLSTVTNFSFR